MKAIVDTCIIIDVLQSRQPFCISAQKIFLLAANEKFTGYITAKSVDDIYCLTHLLTNSDRETRDILTKLFSIFTVTDTASDDCYRAVFSKTSDYEDAIMIETAIRTGVDCIITRNTGDYKRSTVNVCTPDEFISAISDNLT